MKISASRTDGLVESGDVTLPAYVLITPARNEEDHIRATIESVIHQTHRPSIWVIVSDGSTDRTDEIVAEYLDRCPWIRFLRIPEHRDRNFAAKVACFNAGYQSLINETYDVIGNLDADISFEPDYCEFLMTRFAEDSALGVAGTPFSENNATYDYRYTSQNHVSGACQLFRRECFEGIGGYLPVKGGGIDWIAVTTARMNGWKTRTFTDMVCHHHRPMGTASVGKWKAWYRLGQQEYYLGNHPVWQLFRACFQLKSKPYIVGGALLLGGYLASFLAGSERQVPVELIQFHRREQMQRLRRVLAGKF